MSVFMGHAPAVSGHRWGGRWSEAGLRTSGSTPDHPPSQPCGPVAARTRVGGRSPVTAAGPCWSHTGVPILPTGAPRVSSCQPRLYRVAPAGRWLPDESRADSVMYRRLPAEFAHARGRVVHLHHARGTKCRESARHERTRRAWLGAQPSSAAISAFTAALCSARKKCPPGKTLTRNGPVVCSRQAWASSREVFVSASPVSTVIPQPRLRPGSQTYDSIAW